MLRILQDWHQQRVFCRINHAPVQKLYVWPQLENVMNNLRRCIAMGLFIVIAGGVASAYADVGEEHRHNPPPFSDFDMDKNGFVSESEFDLIRAQRMAARAAEGRKLHCAATAPAFSNLDKDGDGQLSEEELTAGQQAHRAECRAMGQGAGRGDRGDPPAFSDFDSDGDGVINETEFNEGHARRMSERVAQGRQLKNAGDTPGFSGIDTNNDGGISEQEFSDHLATHHEDMHRKQNTER